MGQAPYAVKLDGDADTIAPWIASVELSLSMDLLDAIRVEITNPSPELRDAVLAKCAVGVPWVFTLGKTNFDGDVVRVEHRLRRDQERIVVFGLEKLHRLRSAGVSEIDTEAKDKVIATLIKKSGAKVTATAVEATAKEMVVLEPSALGLVKRWCLERNFAVHYDGKTLQFAPRGKGAGAVATADWTDVRELRVDTDLSEVVTGVKVLGWDHVKDAGVEYQAAASTVKAFSGGATGPSARNKAFGEAAVVLDRRFEASMNKEAQELAKGELSRRADTFLTGTAMVDGLPAALPGGKFEIDGAPWPYMGPFVIRSVVHRIAAGSDFSTTVGFFSNSVPK